MYKLKKKVDKSEESEVLLFCDASHINETFCPSKVWQPKGALHNFKFFSQKRGERVSVMGALNASTNDLSYRLTDGSVNKTFFALFLDQLAEQHPNKKIHLVLDNARYQNNDEIKNKAKMLGISLVFLPPYCPNLNLIERLWKFMKKKIAQQKIFANFSQINLLLSNFFRNFADEEFKLSLIPLFNFKFQIL